MRHESDEFYEEHDVQDESSKTVTDKKFNKKLLVCRIFGIILDIVGLVLFVSGATASVGISIVGMFLMVIGETLTVIGFAPHVTKLQAKIARSSQEYAAGALKDLSKTTINLGKDIQEENKDSLSQMASTMAEINQTAITNTARAVKKGLKDTKFCKECGAQIDADSKFCNNCGTKQ